MLTIGTRGEALDVVNPGNTAATHASGTLPVYATPAMIQLMERAANNSVYGALEAGQATVGVAVNIRHLAATPLGMAVRAQSELIAIDRRRLTFRVEAFDEKGLIGEGTHERFIIDEKAFMEKASSR